MVIIFDLDDTLYDEKTFVYSGFEQVASWISNISNHPKEEIFNFMKTDLEKNGRGSIFDNTLEKYYKKNKTNIKNCINIYRLHKPKIQLKPEIINLLNELKQKYSLYIVTDGNKLVQTNKVNALGVENLVKKVYITYRYGLKASKPSLICFEKIKQLEGVNWEKLVYIGDNPKKDFVNLNSVNALTIRILQGDFANLIVEKLYDAKYKINELSEIIEIIKNENQRIPY
jgi:putative hydrolase of the HAD superfamily